MAVSIAINLMPLLQHPTPVATYVANLPWPEIPAEDESRYPFYATARSAHGRPTVVPFAALELEPTANPWRVVLVVLADDEARRPRALARR